MSRRVRKWESRKVSRKSESQMSKVADPVFDPEGSDPNGSEVELSSTSRRVCKVSRNSFAGRKY